MRYGMLIDTTKCYGCNACTIICKQRHATPPAVMWARVYETEEGEYPNARRAFQPAFCMQCANPACVAACPTAASWRDEETGIVGVRQDDCIGCGSCQQACPYGARFIWDGESSYFDADVTPVGYAEAYAGAFAPNTASKCVFCYDRLEAGMQPACVSVCAAGTIMFGDLDDEASELVTAIAERGAVQLMPEAGTDPSAYYVL